MAAGNITNGIRIRSTVCNQPALIETNTYSSTTSAIDMIAPNRRYASGARSGVGPLFDNKRLARGRSPCADAQHDSRTSAATTTHPR